MILDLTSRDTLPNEGGWSVKIPNPTPEGPPENWDEELFEQLAEALRQDYFKASQFILDSREHGHWGDDCGDYASAAADLASMLHSNWGHAMWFSDLFSDDDVDELNLWLNCADADHCIHQMACDGVAGTFFDRLAVDWESCPINLATDQALAVYQANQKEGE